MYERPSWFSFHFTTSSSSIDIYHTLILNELMNYFNVERSTKENENHSIPRGHKRQKSSTRMKMKRFNRSLDSNIYIYTRNKEIKTFHRSRFQTFHRSGVCTRLKRCQRAAKRCLSQ